MFLQHIYNDESLSKEETWNFVFNKTEWTAVCMKLCNNYIWTETTSGLPPALLHDVDGPVDGARGPADVPVPHGEVTVLDRGGRIHTVSR